VTVQFADATNKDFHLRVGDTAARGNGVNLSGDANLAFTTDIDNQARPATSAWDIGADQTRATMINTPDKLAGPTLGLVGNWTFDGADMDWRKDFAYDRSSSYATGTITNMSTSTAPVPGVSGQALKFNGVSSYVNIADSPNWDFNPGTQQRTATAWVKFSNIPTNNPTIWSANFTNAYAFYFRGDVKGLCFYDGNLTQASTAINFTAGQWYFLTWVVNAGTVYFYVNGNSYGSDGPATNANRRPTGAAIGGDPSGGLFDYFNGSIDEVRIYNRALTASEITNLYQIGAARLKVNTPDTKAGPQGSSLVGNWTFNGPDMNWTSATAGSAYDRSGSYATGTLTNMSRSSSPVPGISGQALSFDGVDDYVNVSDSNSLDPSTAVTISAWVKPSSLNGDCDTVGGDMIIQKWNNWPANGQYVFCAYTGGYLRALFSDGATGGAIATNAGAVSTGTWQHVVVTFDAGAVNFYVNGSNVKSGSVPPTSLRTTDYTDDNLYISSDFGSTWIFPGLIDEVRLYNRALTASEIQQLYQAGSRRAKITQ